MVQNGHYARARGVTDMQVKYTFFQNKIFMLLSRVLNSIHEIVYCQIIIKSFLFI